MATTTPIRSIAKTIDTPMPANLIVLDDGVSMGKAELGASVEAVANPLVDEKIATLDLGTASKEDVGAFATATQGGKADTAVQPDDLSPVATSGVYDDLTSKPTLGTAAAKDVGTEADKIAAGDDIRLGYTRSQLAARSVPAPILWMQTSGYAAAGDGGGVRYRRVSDEPSHPGKVQSTDGAWWELDFTGEVDVRALGAKLDGTAAASTTAAINDAVKVAAAFGGGTVRFGAGTALLTNTNSGAASWDNYRAIFVGHDNIKLIGDGTKLLLADGADAHVIQIGSRTTDLTPVKHVEVCGFEVDGNRANQTAPTEYTDHWNGIWAASGCENIDIHHNVIHDTQYYGVGMQRQDILNSKVRDNIIYNTGGDGIDWKDDLDNTYGNVVENNTVSDFGLATDLLTGQAGIDLRSGIVCRNNRVLGFTGPLSESGIRLQNGTAGATPVQPTTVDGFSIYGGGSADTTRGVRVITRYGRVMNGFVRAVGGDGYNLSDPDARFGNLFAQECGVGFRLWQNAAAGNEADTAALIGCIARACTQAGVIADSVDDLTLLGCEIRSNVLGLDIRTGSTNVRMIGGSLTGNTTQLSDAGTSPAVFLAVAGYRTRQVITQSAAIDATSTVSLTFTHLLGYAPAVGDVRLGLQRSTNVGDWTAGFLWVTGTTTTTVTAQLRVLTASATSGAVVNVVCEIDTKRS